MFLTTLLLGMDRWCLGLWNCSVPNAHKHWVSFVTGNLPGNFVMNWEIIRLSFKCQKPRAIHMVFHAWSLEPLGACVMPLSIILQWTKKRTQASLTVCPSCFAGLLPHKHFHPPQICYAMSMKASNWHIARLYHAAYSEPCITATSQTLLQRLRNSHVIIAVPPI